MVSFVTVEKQNIYVVADLQYAKQIYLNKLASAARFGYANITHV